jgi:cation diffusion facilitator CzcD-associated flavoprotein CzcO
VVVGAGFSGIGAAVRLREAGFNDVLVLEKGTQLGGTWRENTYPGCACDVPSTLYSYSFTPDAAWSRVFAGPGDPGLSAGDSRAVPAR